ncbi:TonB family protein [Cellulophaga algicola DSM 14237]|uniref:TonB family protein n=1 Tax=Cellulophaga algicola (strain DSM 14237 / IC166 / ACAM 630) TaxID=688270 RepID=E6X5A4_CELAD|nr:energy transducer TonB [Cellulophaga algicola]ADV49440.1 TonB family protein [Cellulophaga algicola DSM 14237]
MKTILIYLLALISGTIQLYSQEDTAITFFPVEQLIHENCKKSKDTNQCLESILLKKVELALNNIEKSTKSYKDTLNIYVNFNTNKLGEIIEANISTFANDSIIKRKIGDSLKKSITKIPAFKVENRKTDKYISSHSFNFYFTQEVNHKFTSISTPENEIYKGGEITRIPLFEGQVYTDQQTDQRNFQSQIVNHIRKHFRYPEIAQEIGVQGVVYVNFKINEEGKVEKMRAKGPASLLEEAQSIISKLPTFRPGTLNGQPTTIAFTIPISFKLQ